MKIACLFVTLSYLWEAQGYPAFYPYYGSNMDSYSFGAENGRGGMVLSRYYNPYQANRGAGGGLAAFMVQQPDEQPQARPSQYYLPDRRRQIPETAYLPPQQNEVYPALPERPIVTEATELADPTEKTEILATTSRAVVVPELTEPEVEEVVEPIQPKRRVTKKKQIKKPVVEEEEDDEDDVPARIPGGSLPGGNLPAGTFFPMIFGWGGKSGGGGAPGGATAIANAYSTGRGGVATSHATAYGEPRPELVRSP